MTRFVVDLGGVEMSEATQAELSTSIQKMVLNQVADLRVDKPLGFRFPREWWGIILHPDLDHLRGLEKQISDFAGR